MSAYESYETTEMPRRHRPHREHRRRDDREPRYQEAAEETYIRGPTMEAQPQYMSRHDHALNRLDSPVEEIQREFPPPTYDQRRIVVRDKGYEQAPIRSRSVDRMRQRDTRHGAYLDPRRSERDIVNEKHVSRHRSLSRNQKIAAAVGGAALAVGAKEAWDFKERRGHPDRPHDRNLMANAAIGAAGAFAGYQGAEGYEKFQERKHKTKYTKEMEYDRNGHVTERDPYEERPKPSRRKSIVEQAMGLAGLGATAKASDRDRDRDRGRRGSYSSDDGRRRRRSRSRSTTNDHVAKLQAAAKAALVAGAAEAFRVRKEPGGFDGAKGKRILTAAITAGGVGAAASRGDEDGKSKRHLLEAVVGGLAGTRAVHGSRKDLDVDDDGKSIRDRSRSRAGSRSRARSHSRGGSSGGGLGGLPLAAMATAGMGLLANKVRSRSRKRDSSDDSYRSRRTDHKRSKSVTDYARKGLAALGIGETARDASRSRSRDREIIEETKVRKSRRRRDSRDYDSSDDEYDRRRGPRSGKGPDREYDRRGGRDRDSLRDSGGRHRRVAEGKQNISDSDSLGSSSGDNKRIKKMRGKQIITAGLAGVASIHAANGVYQSWEKRKSRHKAVLEGDLSPEQAKKLKAKSRFQDAASVGIAVLGVKGAISEWKDMSEKRHEYRKAEEEKKHRDQRRLERRKSVSRGPSKDRKTIGNGPADHSDGEVGARPRYRRNTSFPNRSTGELNYRDRPESGPRYYDNYDYYHDPQPPYGAAPTQHLPPPPLGYDYDRR